MDGVVSGDNISNINPQDIEEITVIKDAAFAPAYGAQGATSVILIVTKKRRTPMNKAAVSNHNESAYAYSI